MLIKKIVMLLSTYFLTISCIAQPPNDRVELDDESREASTNTIEAYESDALYPGWWDTKFNLWPPYVYQYKNGKLFFTPVKMVIRIHLHTILKPVSSFLKIS